MLKHKHGFKAIHVLLVMCLATVLAASGRAQAADSLRNVAESYRTDTSLQQGMIVQLKEDDKSSVKAATYNNAARVFGVTVAPSDTPVSLSSENGEQQAYVVSSGRYNVLVSNQNGEVKTGDYITISAIDGIGMKASGNESTVLGRAVGSFDGRSNVISTTPILLQDGKKATAAIGSVVVDVAIRANPNFTGAGGVPSFVQSFAISVAGQPISPAQLYASMALLLVGLGIVTVLIYSGIQTSMAAIGRNPLARQSIMRNMLQVIIIGLLIFIGCLIAVYLILKL